MSKCASHCILDTSLALGTFPSASDVSSYNREANEIQKRVTEANDRGNVGAQYQVMKEYAKKYGWNLTRKRTS